MANSQKILKLYTLKKLSILKKKNTLEISKTDRPQSTKHEASRLRLLSANLCQAASA